ncbi:MAG: hypothetical protein KME23_21355 [Goleter apudmare HA4340-LM2]|nr:hypothetical protein [Goleter apudmare HA4340-LM2]
MNLLAVASLNNNLSLHVLVEQVSSRHFIASVPELLDCAVEAETRSDVLAAVQEKVKARLTNLEVLTLEVANNPWTDFIGMFEGDDEFADLAQELRNERELGINGIV